MYAAIALAVRVMLSGDVMPGRGVDQIQRHSVDPVLYEGFVRSAKEYVAIAEEKNGPIPRRVAPEYVWGDALAVVRTLDPAARIVNLETAVTTSSTPWPGKGINYRMHPANVAILTAARISCAVLSNNHVLDWGTKGLTETIATLHGAHIQTAGAGADLVTASRPALIDVPDGRVLVVAMCDVSAGVPRDWAATASRPGVRLLPDLSPQTARQIADEIRKQRKAGDRVIVSIHWGGNWGYDVATDEVQFAHALVDSGVVDVVHGHSSHHPKRIEIYRDRLILYGAGDLINDYEGIGGYEQYRPELSLIYVPQLAADGRLESLTLVPMRMRKFQLHRASAEERAWLLERVNAEARGARFEVTRDGWLQLLLPRLSGGEGGPRPDEGAAPHSRRRASHATALSPLRGARGSAREIPNRLQDLLTRIHHERTVRDHRLPDRIRVAEDDEGVADCLDVDDVAVIVHVGEVKLARGDAADLCGAAHDVREHAPSARRRERDARAGAQVDGHHRDAGERLNGCAVAGDAVDRPAVTRFVRDLVFLQSDVARLGHLQPRRQVDPELQDLERAAAPQELLRRELRVFDAAPGRHPLHAARTDDALVAGAVAMRERPVEDERDRLEPAVRMRPERQSAVAGGIDLRTVMVEKEERVDLVEFLVGQRTPGAEVADVVGLGAVLFSHASARHEYRAPAGRRWPQPG